MPKRLTPHPEPEPEPDPNFGFISDIFPVPSAGRGMTGVSTRSPARIVVVMVLYHSSQLDKNELTSLSQGKIQIQSEGSEIYYRKIELENIKKFPVELLNSN